MVSKALHTLVSCTTSRDKTLVLVFLSLVSFVFAVAVDYLCFLLIGPTSLGTWYNPYWIGFFFACGFLIAAFFVFRHDIKTKPENLFLAIVLSITCFSSLAFYVNKTSWDVDVHYLFVVEWTGPDLMADLSISDERMIFGSSTERYLELNAINDFSNALDAGDTIGSERSIQGSLSQIYQRISSLPASLVFIICTALSVPFSLKYVLSRLIYALIYSFVTFFGMKKLKSGKMLYAVIALLPTAIFLAANYSYDYWVNAFVLFAVACLVRELQTPAEKITKKRIALLLGSFIIAFGPKAIYFPLILLCLLIPKRKFSSAFASKFFRCGVIFTSLLVAASFLIPYFFITGPGIGDIRGGSDVNSSEQIRFILSHPLEYAQILFSFLLEYFSIPVSRFYMGFYAYLGFTSWPFWAVMLFLMVFTAITDKSEADKTVCTWKSRVLVIALNLITVVLFATAFYVSYTVVGSETIAGCQPRYLIPLLFSTLVFLSSSRFAWPRCDRKKTVYNITVLGLMSLINMVGLWQVYIHFIY